jgi:hypothetical protein
MVGAPGIFATSAASTKKSRSFHKFALKPSFYPHIELRSAASPVTCFRVFQLNEIDPEIAALLELLIVNEEFDETAEQFKQLSRSWHQYSEEEKKMLLARAASMISKGRD